MNYRVIALDLDGTLLDNKKSILPQSLSALSEARSVGIKIIVVTGRHHIAVYPFYQELEISTPAICCNGAYIYDFNNKKVLESDPLPPNESKLVLRILEGSDIKVMMYVDDAILYEKINSNVIQALSWAKTLTKTQRPTLRKVHSLMQAIEEVQSIWKFALSHTHAPTLRHFSELIEKELELSCEWSWHDQVDITKSDNSKGKRLQQWVVSQGLNMNQVVAFGDNYNDLSMLKSVGLGVAMGNADDAIKACADLTISDHMQPGIAEVIRTKVLGK